MTEANKISLRRRADYAAWIVLALICSVYIFRTNSIFYFHGGDNANYVLLAKALAGGEGYRDTFKPGAPPHTHYPPLFPLMLAAVVAFRGIDIFFMKLLVSIGAAATLILTFILLRRRSFALPLMAVVWFGCSNIFFSHSDKLLSETIFMAFAIASLLFFDKWLEKGGWKSLVITVIACWAAQMTRTAGVTIAPAVGFTSLLRRDKSKKNILESVALMSICLLPAFVWGLRNHMVSGGEAAGYLSQLLSVDPYDPTRGYIGVMGFVVRFLDNARAYIFDTNGLLWIDFGTVNLPKTGIWTIMILFWVLVIIGFGSRVGKGIGVTEVFIFFYIGMISIWPFRGSRFMMPAYPFLMAYTVEGASVVIHLFSEKRKAVKWTIASLLIVIFSVSLSINALGSGIQHFRTSERIKRKKIRVDEGIYMYTFWEDYDRLLRLCMWLARKTEPGALVMARKPRLVALASGHPVIGVPLVMPDDPKKWLIEKEIRYILVDEAYPNTIEFMRALTGGEKLIPGVKISFGLGYTMLVEITPSLLE